MTAAMSATMAVVITDSLSPSLQNQSCSVLYRAYISVRKTGLGTRSYRFSVYCTAQSTLNQSWPAILCSLPTRRKGSSSPRPTGSTSGLETSSSLRSALGATLWLISQSSAHSRTFWLLGRGLSRTAPSRTASSERWWSHSRRARIILALNFSLCISWWRGGRRRWRGWRWGRKSWVVGAGLRWIEIK